MNDQSVSYDSWGNVSSVTQTDNTDFYYHSIEYGPDLNRVTSTTSKTYNILYEKFYWDDYEERQVGNDLYQYYYIHGGDGLAALYVVKTSPNNQTATYTYKAITDHLGSIVCLRGNYNWGFMADYDAWGNREVQYPCSFDQYFDRGYTGHEHLLTEFGLINMNGRMYDPNLGRFLSPDNYIQSPYNPQNYNRYSYCLNNPLKYTDSDGEFWEEIFFDPFTFGLGNTLAHLIRGDIKTLGDGLKSFGQGFLTGAALSVTWSLAPCIPIVGDALQAYMSGNAYLSTGMMALGITSGWKRCFYTWNWSTLTNSLELMLGNYYIDENAGFWEGIGQGYSRHTWESLQTTIGHGYSQARNLVWNNVDRVDFMAGATYATTENKSIQNGVTLGNYINVNIWDEITGGFEDRVLSDPLFMHEYGHTIDSRGYGPSYLFTIGWSSMNSARTCYDIDRRNTHDWHWTELRANNNASRYFQKHYTSVDWSIYTDFYNSDDYKYYPLVAPVLPKSYYRR
jgi:RHS repeat-associated protein